MYKTTASPAPTSEPNTASPFQNSLAGIKTAESIAPTISMLQRRQRPRFFEEPRKKASKKRRRRADDDIERGDGRKQIRDQAAKREADRERGFQRDERAKGFGNPELDVSVGERGRQDRDGGIEPCNETIEGNLA